jgi:hypothetical protein
MNNTELKNVVETIIALIKEKGIQRKDLPFEYIFHFDFPYIFPSNYVRIAQVLDMIYNYDGPKTKYKRLTDIYLYDFAKRKYYTEYLSDMYDIFNEEYENLKVIFDDDREGTESDLDFLNTVIDTLLALTEGLFNRQFDDNQEKNDKIKDLIIELFAKWRRLHSDCVSFAFFNPDDKLVKKIDKFLFFKYVINK